jgi:hypothetical protein
MTKRNLAALEAAKQEALKSPFVKRRFKGIFQTINTPQPSVTSAPELP